MTPEAATVYQEEPFELADFVTEDMHPTLLKRLKAAEGSLLAAKARRSAFSEITAADAEELCQMIRSSQTQGTSAEDKESPGLDFEGFLLLSGPLLGLPLPGLSRARDDDDSDEEDPTLEEMLRYPEAEAIYKQLRKDQEGCVPANVLSEELAKPSQVSSFLEERAGLCAAPMKSRRKLERLINWRIERDDALGTLFFTFILLIGLYFIVQVDLDIKNQQMAETAVSNYITTFGSQLTGPFLDEHIADVTSFWSWVSDSALAAFFGLPVLGADGITRFHLAGSNILLGDVMISHSNKDAQKASSWLLHTSTAQDYLRNSTDYTGAAKAALQSLRTGSELNDPRSQEIELSFSMHNELARKLLLVKVNSRFSVTGEMDLRIFSSACADSAEVSPEQLVVNILFLLTICWLAFAELKDAVAALSHGCEAFTKYWGFWNTVDWTCIALAIVTMVMWAVSLVYINSDLLQSVRQEGFDSLSLSEGQLQSMQDELFAIKNWIMTVRVLTTLLAITIVMKFFKGFRANPRLQIVADAIAKSVNNVAHFFLIFWTLFACFAIVAHVLFGSDIILFSSLVSSLEASMSTLMGEFEWYVQISGTKSGFLNSGLPLAFVHIWFVVYICFALLVLFNMLLAMVLDSYGAAAQVLGKRADAPTILTQTWRYFRRWKETRGFIPLVVLARMLLSVECHPNKVVTLSSLQAAFPHMKPVQARYLMRTLFEEDKRQKATQRVLTGEDSLMGAPGPSQDLDPKEIATACVPLFMAATQPVMSEFMTKLAALEAKVNALESEGLLDAVATSAQANFAKDMLEGIHVQPTTLMGRPSRQACCCIDGNYEFPVEQI